MVQNLSYTSEDLQPASGDSPLSGVEIRDQYSFTSAPNIQGVTGGTDQTSGECSLGQTIPI